MKRPHLLLLLMMLLCAAATSCRVTQHISSEEAVVSRVEIRVDGVPTQDAQLRMALQQRPYRRTFGFLPISAWIWHPDTVSSWHRFRQRLGTQPAVYQERLAQLTEAKMNVVMKQKGYLDAQVSHHTEVRDHKAYTVFEVVSGRPRYLSSVQYSSPDTSLMRIVDASADASAIAVGQMLDRSRLNAERERLTSLLREHGYYYFDKEHISFLADTLADSNDVDLTCVLAGGQYPWQVRDVHFITNYDMLTHDAEAGEPADSHTESMSQAGYWVTWSGERCYLREKTLVRNCFVLPGMTYSERAVRNTYAAMSRLHILRYVRIRLEPVADSHQLDCFIEMTPVQNHTIQFEIDGTNTAGDLGIALGTTYSHHNAFRGSETFSTHLRGSYESLSGQVENLVNNHYREYGADVSLEFPQLLSPFLSDDVRRRSRATTTVNLGYSSQSRPEYNRRVAQGSLTYKWSSPSGSARHAWDVLNLSYVYLPNQTETFKELIEHLGPIIYSSFTSHFILGMDYTLYMGNSTLGSGRVANTRRDLWSLRVNHEIAGNVLYSLCNVLRVGKTDEGRYQIFDQPFEQYGRIDLDWSYSHYLTDRSRLALHGAGGVAVPFGNSDVMPFEKRYYSGGANSVRGWSVRELGPGRYASSGTSYNYFNQCGDIRLDASAEVRTRLFWKFESAAFFDAGNVWTIKSYANQVGGEFTKDFYRQIAASVGLGLRVVTDFVILRFDWGFKGYDPSADADETWPICHPFRRNHNTLHFAVGYPF